MYSIQFVDKKHLFLNQNTGYFCQIFTFCDGWVLNKYVLLSLIICIYCFAFFFLFLEMIHSPRPVEPEPPASPSVLSACSETQGPS